MDSLSALRAHIAAFSGVTLAKAEQPPHGWHEEDHPRDHDGRFGHAGGSGYSAWPDNFPNATAQTTGAVLRSHPDYRAAKAGDNDAAYRVIRDITGKKQIQKLLDIAKRHPGALVVPVHAEEAAGRNKLPRKYADHIGDVTGLAVDARIVQSSKVGHTGATAAHRFANRAEFNGPVEAGKDYIIVDDFVTAGGTVNELRAHIERGGGHVVAVSALCLAQGSSVLALQPKTQLAIEAKFGKHEVRRFLSDLGIYNGNHQALTESEARWLLQNGSLDAAGNRILAARQHRSTPAQPTDVRHTGTSGMASEDGAAGEVLKSALDFDSLTKSYLTHKSLPKPLYVSRRVRNAADIIAWAKRQGFKSTLPAEDIHVTQVYSRKPMDWDVVVANSERLIAFGDEHSVVGRLGEKGAAVLYFDHPYLRHRWQQFRDAGASWDYDAYNPHLTISYDAGDLDLSQVEPYNGLIELGAERYEPLDEDWGDKVEETPVMMKSALDFDSIAAPDFVKSAVFRFPHEPTPAQIKAGNYPKRKIAWRGLTISIENEAGSVRRGVDCSSSPTQFLKCLPNALRSDSGFL